MVVARFHLVCPLCVAHLKIVLDFCSCHLNDIELVLVFIEVEHISHCHRTCIYCCVHSQRTIESNIGTCYFHLEVKDEVYEGR